MVLAGELNNWQIEKFLRELAHKMYVVSIFDCCRSARNDSLKPKDPDFKDNFIGIFGCPPCHEVPADSTLCIDIFTWLNNKAKEK